MLLPCRDSGQMAKGKGKAQDGNGDPRVRPLRAAQLMTVRRFAVIAAAMSVGMALKGAATITLDTVRKAKNWATAGELLSGFAEEMQVAKANILHPDRMCQRWLQRFMKIGRITDAPRSGRKPKIPLDVLSVCYDVIINGQFSSMREAAKHTFIAIVLKKFKVTVRTLFRNLHGLDPDLQKCVNVEHKQMLTPQHKAKRLMMAIEWLRHGVLAAARGVKQVAVKDASGNVVASAGQVPMPPPPPRDLPSGKPAPRPYLNLEWIKRIIWVDAKKFYVQPEDYKVWGIKGDQSLVVYDKRVRKGWCIHYYSAVNYLFGGILLVLVSGTTGKGYSPAKAYQVSSRPCACSIR